MVTATGVHPAGRAFETDEDFVVEIELHELEATIDAADCDAVVTGTPIDLGRLISPRHPIRHVTYELEELGTPTLHDVLDPTLRRAALPAGAR
jgi:predicted GTPase